MHDGADKINITKVIDKRPNCDKLYLQKRYVYI